jgi:hypothetical protein
MVTRPASRGEAPVPRRLQGNRGLFFWVDPREGRSCFARRAVEKRSQPKPPPLALGQITARVPC